MAKEEEVFLHFTNNEAFESIIRSKTFRLYNYDNLSDKFEISLPLSILLKEIFHNFPGNTFNENDTEDNIIFYILFIFYLKNVEWKNYNSDFVIVLHYIIENLNNNNFILNYKDILPFVKKFQVIHNDNLGIYLSSFCKVEISNFNHYKTRVSNFIQNVNKDDQTSGSRIFSDMKLNNLWERYGDRQQGVAIKFNKKNIEHFNDGKLKFENVKYEIVEDVINNFYYPDNCVNMFQIKDKICKLDTEIKIESLEKFQFDSIDKLKDILEKKEFKDFLITYMNKFQNLINTEIPFMKMKTFEHEKEYRLIVTKNINDTKNITNFKTDPIKNTTFYELDFSSIYTKKDPLEVIIGMQNNKFLNTSYRETFQREFPFVKFSM